MNLLQSAQRAVGFIVARPVAGAVVVIALLLFAAECASFLGEQRRATAPRLALEPPHAANWERVVVGGSGPLTALRPPERERRRLEREFGVELPAQPGKPADNPGGGSAHLAPGEISPPAPAQREVLALRELPPMPTGGKVLVTLPPEGGEVEVTVRANRARFLELTGVYGIGGLAGLDQEGRRWRGYAFAEPLRVGRFYVRAEAGVEGRARGSGFYALAGLEWRSK